MSVCAFPGPPLALAANRLTGAGNPEKPTVRFSTELKGHAAAIHKVAFNPVKDGELCSVSDDGVVKFWDVRTKNCVNEVKGLGDAFTLVWAPDGESLIVGNKVSTPDDIFFYERARETESTTRATTCSSCHRLSPHHYHPTSNLCRRTK